MINWQFIYPRWGVAWAGYLESMGDVAKSRVAKAVKEKLRVKPPPATEEEAEERAQPLWKQLLSPLAKFIKKRFPGTYDRIFNTIQKRRKLISALAPPGAEAAIAAAEAAAAKAEAPIEVVLEDPAGAPPAAAPAAAPPASPLSPLVGSPLASPADPSFSGEQTPLDLQRSYLKKSVDKQEREDTAAQAKEMTDTYIRDKASKEAIEKATDVIDKVVTKIVDAWEKFWPAFCAVVNVLLVRGLNVLILNQSIRLAELFRLYRVTCVPLNQTRVPCTHLASRACLHCAVPYRHSADHRPAGSFRQPVGLAGQPRRQRPRVRP